MLLAEDAPSERRCLSPHGSPEVPNYLVLTCPKQHLTLASFAVQYAVEPMQKPAGLTLEAAVVIPVTCLIVEDCLQHCST